VSWFNASLPIGLASDHAGFALKEKVKEHLVEKGYQVLDFGTDGPERVDYPDFGKACAVAVAEERCAAGVVICGTGIGMSIVANKVRGIRAALCNSVTEARLARQHNDANILAMGGRILGETVALDILDVWLATEYEGGRHQRRLDKIAALEQEQSG